VFRSDSRLPPGGPDINEVGGPQLIMDIGPEMLDGGPVSIGPFELVGGLVQTICIEPLDGGPDAINPLLLGLVMLVLLEESELGAFNPTFGPQFKSTCCDDTLAVLFGLLFKLFAFVLPFDVQGPPLLTLFKMLLFEHDFDVKP
jgi:hypothetical protein